MRPIPSARVVDIIPLVAMLLTDLMNDFDPDRICSLFDRIFSLLNISLGTPLGKNLLDCAEEIKTTYRIIGKANLNLAELYILFVIECLAIMKANFRMS